MSRAADARRVRGVQPLPRAAQLAAHRVRLGHQHRAARSGVLGADAATSSTRRPQRRGPGGLKTKPPYGRLTTKPRRRTRPPSLPIVRGALSPARHIPVSVGGPDVLKDVSFVVEPGATARHRGANRLGKSTLVNLLHAARTNRRRARCSSTASTCATCHWPSFGRGDRRGSAGAVSVLRDVGGNVAVRAGRGVGRGRRSRARRPGAADARPARGDIADVPDRLRHARRASAASRCPADRSSASRSRARSPSTRASSCWTMRSRRSIPATEERILASLREVRRIADLRDRRAPRLDVRDADLILVLADGRVVERGTHADSSAQGGLYAEMHRAAAARGRTRESRA